LLLALLGAMTHLRNRDYHSEIALWQSSVRQAPHNARAWNNLGYALWLEGRAADARQAWLEALRLDPGYDKPRRNLERMSGP
jgi:Flp pilus assembly protein TadD